MPGKHLTVQQRVIIASMIEADPGVTCAAIGRQVGVAASTISRELRRDGKTRADWTVFSAQLDADTRRRRPKPFRVQTSARLRKEIAKGLAKRWSPDQISGRLKLEHPETPELHMSPAAIYHSIYLLGRTRLLAELDHPLRRGGKGPRRRGVAYERIKDATPISERPQEAADRLPGHWEGDLIKGRLNASAIATLVERHTRYTLTCPLPTGWQAPVLAAALVDAFIDLPQRLRATLTWDRGTEMAAHADFTLSTDTKVYFADPHSPWQRPTNENTNGLLRQFLPKGSDLNAVPPEQLREYTDLLNGRPRKILGYRTPAEALNELLTSTDATTP